MSHLRRLREARDDGLADYLEARQLVRAEWYSLAGPLLARARERGLPWPSVEREARRLQATTHVAAGRLNEGEAALREILADDSSSEAERIEARDWLHRARFSRRASRPPAP